MKLSIADINSSSYTSNNVFVLNTTKGQEKGPVIFNCPKVNGRGIDTVTVPDTFLPTNLINFITKAQALESSDFKAAIRRGMITIIDEEEANEIESVEGAREERARLENNQAEVDNLTRSMLGENEAQVTVPQNQQEQVQSSSKISPKVESILASSEENGPITTLNSLRTMESELTIHDLRHIKAFAKKHRIKPVFLYAKELAKRKAQERVAGVKG